MLVGTGRPKKFGGRRLDDEQQFDVVPELNPSAMVHQRRSFT
jgi:hypothetical protein